MFARVARPHCSQGLRLLHLPVLPATATACSCQPAGCSHPPHPQASFGGAGMGIAFGLGAALLLALMFNNPVGELWVIVVASYSLFMVTDEVRWQS